MNVANLLKIALKALYNNKLRCFLTMLGIIIGVASVITMLAIGQGSKNSIKSQISEMGSNMIMIHPGNMQRGGVRQSADDMQTIKVADYEAIQDIPGVAAVSPSVNSGGQLVNGNNNYPSTIYGVTPEFLDIRKFKVKDGVMFTDSDIKSAAKVCILGKTVVDNLFPGGDDPIGRVIRFGKIPMTVIGVLESKGTNSMGQDQDDVVIAPYTTVMKRILAIDYIQGIFASAVDESHTDETIDRITELLRTRHKLKEDDDNDFEIRSQRHDDGASRLHRRNIAPCGRHRHHEHHVRVRDRAHPRDRPAHVNRRARHRHSLPVSHRGRHHQRERRSDRCRAGRSGRCTFSSIPWCCRSWYAPSPACSSAGIPQKKRPASILSKPSAMSEPAGRQRPNERVV